MTQCSLVQIQWGFGQIYCLQLLRKQYSTVPSLSILMNEKAKFKVALKKYLNTHSFYSVDKFFMCNDNNTVV